MLGHTNRHRKAPERRRAPIAILTAAAVTAAVVLSLAATHSGSASPGLAADFTTAPVVSSLRAQNDRRAIAATQHTVAVQAARTAARQARQRARAAAARRAARLLQVQQQGAGGAGPAAPPAPAGNPQQIAAGMLGSYGWAASQFGCLQSLWNQESGWNVYATGPDGSYGIPQALPGPKMASAGSAWQTDAATQIRWGLGYIKGTYGTPCGAWAHEQADGWY